ncbi:SDR family oxidoreductase [Carboxylicivirga sp. RSCT41]|uniref:SDR family oxidoreductase n=1 Tax=Carboxylicivirga agarovorans TaxID=3417570 RepID=UPI003D3437A4
MKVGITGATGQLGQKVIEKLKGEVPAENIVALVRTPSKASDLGIEARAFDFNEPENMLSALEGIDRLLLISGNEIGKRAEQHNNVISAAKQAGIGYIVYTSLLRTDNTSISLAGEHLETEKMIKASGISYTLLRNGWYTENYTASIADVLKTGALYGSSGNGLISSATRTDFAEAAVKVLTTDGHANKTYELAGDEAYTLSDFAAELSKQTGKEIPYVNLPVQDYEKALLEAGLPEPFAQFLAGSHVSTEKGDLFDNGQQLSHLTGRPTTSLKDAIAEALTVIN